MDCASCGRANRPGARFCGGCGSPLAPRCPACGNQSQPGAQFCDACGAPLGAAGAPAAEARKVVTIVFADLIGSTALHERLDAESARRLMDRYHRSMGAVVESHGGTVMQLLGDGVLAGFGVPRVSEDDALRAVRAAVGMQQAFRELVAEQAGLAGDIGLRVAVNTGEVVAGDDHTHVMGDPVNVAARLQQEARDGDVLLGESTQRLVAEKVTLARLGSFVLKGKAEPVATYRVVSLERPAGAPAIAFVGREQELARITAVYDAATTAPAARLAVILGSPGLGKSRLIDEFTRRPGAGATVLMAHCDAAGGATFAPLAEALRGLLRIDDGAGGDALRGAILAALPEGEPERARIADGVAALVAGTPASPEEIFFVVRRGLAALASARPVVLAIDDVQWAEPLLLDLIEHLVQWGSGVPLLVLAAARPELRDTRSSLATPGSLVSDVVTLAGLDAGAATRLAANAIGAAELPAAIAGRILATSEGNPLFVGELVRMLVHDGALKREGDRWTAGVEVAGLEMPPTIHALLAARIERLRPEERTVLERAAVIGRHFSRTALTQLLPREVGDLDARIESLRRSELIEPDTGWFLGEPLLRFHHVLIRDAAYRRLLKNTRAELHGRFADWLEARAAGSVEHDETLGWHLEQAHQHLRELGPIDAQGRALGERAARHLAAAGRRALARDDLTPAASLLERALARLDAGDPSRAELALDWCEAVLSAGDVATAVRAIAELGRFIGASDRLRAWHTCFGGQLAVFTDPKALRASADAVEAAAAALASAGDAAGEAKAHSVHALVLAQLGKIGACEAVLDKALAAARRARDRRRANGVLAGAPVAALWGPSPVTRASGRCLDVVRVLRITQGAPAVEAVALRCQAVLETLRGRADAARRMIASSRRMVEELGITQQVLEADLFAGLIELLEGDAAAAERCLRAAYDGLRGQGLGIDAAQAAALLGRALLAQDRVAEAEAISAESELLAGDSFKAAIAWRGVRAEVLAARGEHASAVEFARAAVEIAAATDDLLDHADARQALSVALRAAGRGAEAGAEEKRAIDLWEAKGATLLVERARRGGAGSTQSPRSPDPSAVSVQSSLRRVRPNAARAAMSRIAAGVETRDAGAIAVMLSDTLETVDHVNGASYGREEFLASFRSLSKPRDLTFVYEPLAVLGDSLAISRRFSSASGAVGKTFDCGAYLQEALLLYEVDEQTLVRRVEIFAPDRLGDAVARLYERYAETLPEGPARARAAATARSVAAALGPADPDRWAKALAPAIEFTDHRSGGLLGFVRGAETILRGMRGLLEVAGDLAFTVDDVLDLRSDSLLVRCTNVGTVRASGGAYERQYLQLLAFGSDGLATRAEWFDADRDAEALARFDELAVAVPRPTRRARSNAATAATERLSAAFAARDEDALASLIADGLESFEHPIGAAVGREGVLASLQAILRSSGPSFRYETLATLGESLGLARRWWSSDATSGGSFDVAASEGEVISVFEVDDRARFRWVEIFAPNHLGDAIVRLYERYAELLPDGLERTRAAATARSVAAMLAQRAEFDRWASAWAPTLEHVDHRTVGFGGVLAAHEFRAAIATLFELTDDVATRIDDIVELRSNALLLRWTNFGTQRTGGGSYERPFLWLGVFRADGLSTRIELFDPDRETEALARFDELTAGPPKPERRVRANAGTRGLERLVEVLAARDRDGLAHLFDESLRVFHHPSGIEYGRREMLTTWRSALKAGALNFRQQMLASLGDALAIDRHVVSVERLTEAHLTEFGVTEFDEVSLIEADDRGRFLRSEIFAPDRLGDAVVRIYELYAERLPDGPERIRAAATARSIAAFLGSFSPKRWATAFAPAIEVVDHRTLGTWSMRGAEALLQNFRAWVPLTDDTVIRLDGILSLQSDALLFRRTFSGTDRTSGGVFERQFIQLCVFGSDGLMTRLEYFEADRDAEALARLDELTAGPPLPRFANASARSMYRFVRCWRERDWEGLVATLAPAHRVDDRRRLVGVEMSAQESLASLRFVFELPESRVHTELVATRGERLALFRVSLTSQAADTGPMSGEHLQVTEVDADGRTAVVVMFDPDDPDAAYAELDERFAAGEAAPHANVWGVGQRLARVVSARDWEQWPSLFTEDFVLQDHRLLGWGTRSSGEFLAQTRAMAELAPDFELSSDHCLAIDRRGTLVVGGWAGTRDGGPFEIRMLSVASAGPDGRIRRIDTFELDQLDAARACFEELTRGPAALLRIENTVTRAEDAAQRAWNSQDWEAFAALFSPDFQSIDRRPLMRIETNRDRLLAGIRPFFEARAERSAELLATRGERLALFRMRMRGSLGGSGPSEVELLQVTEVDASGLRTASVAFGPEDLKAAHAELDERFRSGEAAPHGATWDATRRFAQALDARDWRAALAALSEDFVFEDHRLLGFGSRSRDEFIEQMRAMVDLSPDVGQRVDHTLAVHDRGLLAIGGWAGTREGGAFEIPSAAVMEVGPDRRIRRIETWEIDQVGAARACFAALTAAPPARILDNAATRHADRTSAVWAARNWKGVTELYSPGFRHHDRKRSTQVGEMDRGQHLEYIRPLFEMPSSRIVMEILATRGEVLALVRERVEVAGRDVGPSEIESLGVFEVDEREQRVATIRFDLGDLDAAYAELDARYAAGEAAPYPSIAAGMQEFKRAFAERDWKALAARCAPDLVVHDRRLLGWETLHGPKAYVDALRQLVDLAPDTRLRIDHTTICANGYLVLTVWEGTREGGAYEAPSLMVAELDREGRIRRFDQYDLERLEEARARLAELRPDPLRIPPNAVTRAMDRAANFIENGDWESMTGLFAPTYHFEDGRRLIRDSGDREKLVASLRLGSEAGFHVSHATLATAGERLALLHLRFRKFEGGALSAEVENLQLFEVDAQGRFVASLVFDSDDRRAASLEMTERYFRAQGSRGVPPAAAEAIDALNNHDLARLRAALPDDFYLDDRRRTGLGRIDGADGYIASVRVFLEQTRDLATDVLYHVAVDRRGSLSVARMFGTLADGGAFENVLVRLGLFRGDRIAGVEVFEPEDLEIARARFEALPR
jgi:class 3 adenylate cyclase/ketosteroid isomerase-like protein